MKGRENQDLNGLSTTGASKDMLEDMNHRLVDVMILLVAASLDHATGMKYISLTNGVYSMYP